jgi:predicted ABC-type transport system involved in lysophospholipase L1 biosynthesis ATPase subunit
MCRQPPVRALDEVSLTVTAGELTGIVGLSGSGKTTLLHLMGTLDRPATGTVRVTGLDVARLRDGELSALRAARIGFVFQQFFLAEHQTVLGNVADGLLYAGVRRGQRRQLAIAALERVGLPYRAGARPTQLSGGQRQRVAIARAIAGRPSAWAPASPADPDVHRRDDNARLQSGALARRVSSKAPDHYQPMRGENPDGHPDRVEEVGPCWKPANRRPGC